MTFEYFNNFFNTTAATTATTTARTNTTGLNTKTATCPRKVNIYHSHDKHNSSDSNGNSNIKNKAFESNKKLCSCLAKIKTEKRKSVIVTTTTLSTSKRLYPLKLKRKIRKTSRRKRKRVYENFVQNETIVNMVNNIKTAKATTTSAALSPAPALEATTTAIATTANVCSSRKYKISVNNSLKSHKYLKLNYSIGRWCCMSTTPTPTTTLNTIGSCDKMYCKYYCNGSCKRKKLKLIVKHIIALLMMPQQTTIVNKITNLAHAATASSNKAALTNKQQLTNHLKRNSDQLNLKCEYFEQFQNLYGLGKQAQQQQQQIIIKNTSPQCGAKTTSCTKFLTTAASTATDMTTSLSSAACDAASHPAGNNNNNNFSTFLTQCKIPTTNKTLAATTTSTATKTLTHHSNYSRSTPLCAAPPPPPPPSSSSSSSSPVFRTWYSVTCLLTPARILNELFGVIFMTLLVFSICHNNVLETSAASIKVTRRDDVVASSLVAVEQIIMPNKNTVAGSRLNGRQYKRPHPPEHLTQPYQQKLTQTSNNININSNNNHHHQQHQQSQSYLNQKEAQQQPLEFNMEEDKSNHIFQPQLEAWQQPQQQQHEPQDRQQDQQQHLTTQAAEAAAAAAILSRDGELETSYNNTFQSLSIIDGDLTVAVDASQNLMTVEEEMLIAASGGAVGVGSNAIGLGNHLHDGSNDLGSFDTAVMGLDGLNVLSHNSEKNSMPIFDFGMPRNITARTGHTEAIIKCRVDRLDDKSVSWIRKRDLHILTVGTATYTSDKRFQVTESKDSREWTLHVKSPQARDSGIYECQVNTEPKMSMAFQLNVIEISPDAKAVITGPADLHFKVGSAIILTCIVHQPSVKDIGPIYWYRGEYMITPFDINENTQEVSAFALAAATPSQTIHNKINVLEQSLLHHHHHHQQQQQPPDGGTYVGAAVAIDTEQMPQIVTNEITQDFAQRIAMESQLGDTMKSRLRISNAQTSDTGNYTCQPTTASSASVMVHVINDENPAAMQKSGTNNILCVDTKSRMPLIFAIIIVAISTSSALLFESI